MLTCQFILSLGLTGLAVPHAGLPLSPSTLRQFHVVPSVTQDSLHAGANGDGTQIRQIRRVQMFTGTAPLNPHCKNFELIVIILFG